jgi:hypothetical protein
MNVKEGLQEIRTRLMENGASEKSIQTVDGVLKRASLPAAQSASATSMLQLVRMLMRSPAANADPEVYDDFVQLESVLEDRATVTRAAREAEDAKPLPKSRKFYKEQKKKQH